MKLRYFLPFITTAVILALIFFFSAQNAEQSTILSRGITAKILKLIPYFRNISASELSLFISDLQFWVRKGAHFTIYMLAGFSSAAMFRRILPSVHFRYILIASVIFCTLYAVSDELHQCFSNGRSAELRDALIDIVGSTIGTFIYIASKNIKIIK